MAVPAPLPVDWQALIDHLACGVVVYDADTRLVVCNADFRRLYAPLADALVPGRRFEELLRLAIARGLLPEAEGREEAFVAQRLHAYAHPGPPIVRRLADGHWRRITERELPDGGRLAFSIDITAEVRQAEQAEAATTRLHEAIEALPDGFALYDADDRLVVCNSRYRELYRESAPAMTLGARFEDLLRYGLERGQYPQAAGREAEWLAARMERHRHPGPPEIQQLPGNRWLRIDERRTRDGGIAGVRTEVTELVRREQELVELNRRLDEARLRLEQLSETDALTGIANRRLFDRRLAEEWSRGKRHGTPLVLLLVDVDHFKRFNDLHGHPAGDRCLQQVAQALAATAGRPTDLVARYGGEEFAVLLPHVDAAGGAAQARRAQQAVAALAIAHGGTPLSPHVTVSVGGVEADPARLADATALLRAADEALYEAKAGGRNRVVFR